MTPLTRSLVASALTLVFAVGLAVILSRFVFGLPAWATLGAAGLTAMAVVSGSAAVILRLRLLPRRWRNGTQRTYQHPGLGVLTFREGIWTGEFPHGDSTISLFLSSAERQPDADILRVALEAVQGLDRFVPVALGFLAMQPAYAGTAGLLEATAISVTRHDPAVTLARIIREGTAPLRYAPQDQPIWGLQFQAHAKRDVLEVFFFRGIPLFADIH